MGEHAQSDIDKESDIDIIIEDDASDSGDNNIQSNEEHTQPKEATSKFKGSKKAGQTDDEPGCPYLPRLKTSIIQVVLNINAELIRLCNEYQNNSLMDDPQLIMYQMRLQSNLAYLASVADHYMDPTRSMPDLRPLPKPTLPSCQGSSIMAKLSHAREVYATYAKAWADQQLELSKRAKAALLDEEKHRLGSIDREHMHEQVEELLKKNRVVYEKSGDEPVAPETFKPFPPFRIPEGTRLPPGLQKWSFENNIACPDEQT
ncbi:hypothetical protein IWW36_001197 [Coemansia brasiliensis]|uniref:SS18 N-terminal domain-containing protein n=1 Tax=Coemansia brasiliensis TaxID=2650707 RepID=A0A9W8I9J2_9FUNG|nr:hypothetical protein IWW36_001197 [Coemansia brasiliensis]